jgi:hypothetical protein
MAPPYQIVGWAGVETFRFACGGIHDQRTAGWRLIGVAALGTAIEASILEGGPSSGTAADARPPWALGTTGTTLGAAATAARSIDPGAIKAGTIETGALRSGSFTGSRTRTIEAALRTGAIAGALAVAIRAIGAICALGPTAKGGAITSITAFRAIRPPFAPGAEGTAGAATGICTAGTGRARARCPGALALVPAAIKTGAHWLTGIGVIGSASSRCASS